MESGKIIHQPKVIGSLDFCIIDLSTTPNAPIGFGPWFLFCRQRCSLQQIPRTTPLQASSVDTHKRELARPFTCFIFCVVCHVGHSRFAFVEAKWSHWKLILSFEYVWKDWNMGTGFQRLHFAQFHE